VDEPEKVTSDNWCNVDLTRVLIHPPCSFGRGVVGPNEPMPSLTSSLGKIWPAYGERDPHPGDAGPIADTHALTLSEMLAVQAMPDGYNVDRVTPRKATEAIANACPVTLHKAIFETIAMSRAAHPGLWLARAHGSASPPDVSAGKVPGACKRVAGEAPRGGGKLARRA
jgi:hypothetical protein